MHEEYEGFPDDQAFHEMMHLFHEMSFFERMGKMFEGFKAPKDSGEYKFAKLQLARLSAPLAALMVPLCLLGALVVFVSLGGESERSIATDYIEPEAPPELEDIDEPIEDPPEMEEPVDVEFQTDIDIEAPQPVDDQPMSPNPVEFDAVAITKSPVKMTGIYGSRNPGARGQALAAYRGTSAGEIAVMRALRWLKEHQNADGSWARSQQPAMTGLGLLAFLAHGETPSSVEFGETVEKAIRWLVDNQEGSGHFRGRDGHDYSHLIATYALC